MKTMLLSAKKDRGNAHPQFAGWRSHLVAEKYRKQKISFIGNSIYR
jgi:hypothetical protein